MPMSSAQIRELYDSVKEQLNQGNPEEAKNLLDKVPLDSSDNIFVEYLQGVCEQELGNHERAKKRFRYVVSADPGFVAAAEALIHLDAEDYSEGELKYLYEIIIAEKPRVSQQISTFMMRHKETQSTVPVPYSDMFKDNDVSVPVSEEHFSDRNLAEDDDKNTDSGADLAGNEDMLNERAQAAKDDPGSMIDPVFGKSPAPADEVSADSSDELMQDFDISESDKMNAEAAVEDAEPAELPESAEPSEPPAETGSEKLLSEFDIPDSDEVDGNDSLSEDEIASLMAQMGITDDDETDASGVQTEAVSVKAEDELGEDIDLDEIERKAAAAAAMEAAALNGVVDEPDLSADSPESEPAGEEVLTIANEETEETAAADPEPEEKVTAAPEETGKSSGSSSGKRKKAAEKSPTDNVRVEENTITGDKIVRVETFTMAEIYIKQGLYHEALQILEKLMEKAEDTSRIEVTIKRVQELLARDKG